MIETGADLLYDPSLGGNHPDLQFNTGFNNYAAAHSDNRCPNDQNQACYWEEPYHGTGVIGTLMGTRNGVSSVGVAPASDPGVTIGKVAYDDYSGNLVVNETDYADAVRNLSYYNTISRNPIGVTSVGFDDTAQAKHPYLHDAFTTAYYQYDVLWFAFANDNVPGKPVILPARFPEVVAVGSLQTSNGQLVRAPISPIDPNVDFVAPGVNLRIPWNRRDSDPSYPYTAYLYGNSFATPIVAGVARLAMQAHPSWTAGDLLYNMQLYARTLGSPDEYGNGMPDAVCLINVGPANCPPDPPPPPSSCGTQIMC